jgi:cytoskeleton protein RodZ
MPSIGETLREARMRQRLDIADVEQRTKIRAKYLRALENEEFGMLPGPTFVKTFLRTYAELLGLDPHRLVDEYRQNYEREDDLEHLQPLGPRPGAGVERRRPLAGGRRGPGPGTLIVVALVAVLALLLVLGLTGGEDDGPSEQAAGTETERTETRERPPRERPAQPRRVRLVVTPAEETYVCLDRGAGTPPVFEGILAEPQTFRGRVLRINLGKTSAQMRVNGRPVPVEPSPDPVGYEFRPRATRPLPSGERPCA